MATRKYKAIRATWPATLLLLVSLALVSALAWQAYQVSRLQYRVAENVLRDYAQLNADELARRAIGEIVYYGLVPLGNATRVESVADATSYFELVKELRGAANGSEGAMQRALTLVEQFLFVNASGTLIRTENELPAAVSDALLEFVRQLNGASDDSPGIRYFETEHDSRAYMFVLAPVAGQRETLGYSGIQISNGGLAPWFDAALERGPLVPTLMDEDFNNSHLVLRLTDLAGNVFYRRGKEPANGIKVSKSLGDVYDGVFSGLVLELSIPSEQAGTLVIGGLPQQRLPLLLLLVVVTFVLLALAGYQVIKERQLTELRKDFVSQVSHELRTPLTHIRMFTETLKLNRVRNAEERDAALEVIDRETQRLAHLVENILQFSRNERGNGRLSFEVRDLIPLLRDVCDEFSRLRPAANLEFTSPAGVAAMVRVDADAMRQVLLNLLDNADKYSTGDCIIHARVSVNSATVAVIIDDNGPGVPPADRERIWNEFYRLSRERESAVAGTGIGLAVVRELVRRHDGEVSVTDSGLGGARFIVELPRNGS